MDLGERARRIFLAGVAAADPRARVLENLAIAPSGRPVLAGEELAPGARLRLVAFGKAAVAMAGAATENLSEELFPGEGIVVVDRGNEGEVPSCRVHVAGHPVPDSAGAVAAREVARHVHGAAPGDGLLVLISGGGSALLPAPVDGVTLADKIAATRRLLACGATIREINTVRKHLSRLKGGGLARLAGPARVESLVLSDVVGDDPATVASGPTAPDPTTFRDALEVLDRHGIAAAVPAAVSARLAAGAAGRHAETPKADDPIFRRVANRIIGGNGASLDAAAREAARLGFDVEILSRSLTGEARGAGARFARRLAEVTGAGRPLAVLAGGETTVTVRGTGTGGRNQELAAAMALAAREVPGTASGWVFLSGGTDGRDGPTEAAGGLVDAGTFARCAAAGLDAAAELARNNSHALLAAAGDLLVTGPTGTNVADLQVLLVDPA